MESLENGAKALPGVMMKGGRFIVWEGLQKGIMGLLDSRIED